MAGKKWRQINIKNCTYYYDDDINNINNFKPRNKKIDKKLFEDIFIYYIGVKPLYLSFAKINGYVKDHDENKYLIVIPTGEKK